MNTRRHTLSIGASCLALAFLDILALNFYRGQFEAIIVALPLFVALGLAGKAAIKLRFITSL
jgi:hypothetical protein